MSIVSKWYCEIVEAIIDFHLYYYKGGDEEGPVVSEVELIVNVATEDSLL